MGDVSGGSGELLVDLPGLEKAIGQLSRADQDFTALIKAYHGTMCYAPEAFGDFGVDDAWSAFDCAWAAELSQTSKALTELIQNVQAAAARIRGTDDGSARRMRSVIPR